MKRVHKSADGKYHIAGKKYHVLVGSRAQVHHGTAYKTTGGLKHGDLMMNKHHRIVSKKKHATAKREKRLEKASYKPKKGKFVLMRKGNRTRSARGSRKSKRTRRNRRKRRGSRRR